jgi:hypothetical protein
MLVSRMFDAERRKVAVFAIKGLSQVREKHGHLLRRIWSEVGNPALHRSRGSPTLSPRMQIEHTVFHP